MKDVENFRSVLLEIYTEGSSICCGRFVLQLHIFIPNKWEVCTVFSHKGGESG